MLKTALNMLAGAILVSAIGYAIAQTAIPANIGVPPLPYGDQALIDQKWLYGIAGGLNNIYQSGITAVGTGQSSAKALPNNVAFFSVDTVTGGGGVNLPQCMAGIAVLVYNNTTTSLIVYPAVTNNPVTGIQDTINNTTAATLSSHTPEDFFCPKNGIWAAK